MKYRVILKVSYYQRYFEFDDPTAAVAFAKTALVHSVPSEGHPDKLVKIVLEVVDKEAGKEKEEVEEDE